MNKPIPSMLFRASVHIHIPASASYISWSASATKETKQTKDI